MSSRGTITYNIAKHLASVIDPLVGHSQYHSKHLVEELSQQAVTEEQSLVSYDVSAFFTCTHIERSFHVIRDRLQGDSKLSNRKVFSVDQICQHLEYW